MESDEVSAAFARHLHPDAVIMQRPMEEANLPPFSRDAVIGNVPFSEVGVFDPSAPEAVTRTLHDYMIWSAVQALAPGGVAVLVTSCGTMDKVTPDARQALDSEAALIGGIRLPSGAFDSQGTGAPADILVLRRRLGDEPLFDPKAPAPIELPEDPLLRTLAQGTWTSVGEGANAYFEAFPEMVLGTTTRHTVYSGQVEVIPDPELAWEQGLQAAVTATVERARSAGLGWQALPDAEELTVATEAAELGLYEGQILAVERPVEAKNGTSKSQQVIAQVVAGRVEEIRTPKGNFKAAEGELLALIELRDAALELFSADADTGQVSDAELAVIRERTLDLYQAYTDRWGPIGRVEVSYQTRKDENGSARETKVIKTPALGGIRADVEFANLLALENYDLETETATPADILLRRVHALVEEPTRADTPAEAVALSLNAHNLIDEPYVASLLGVDPARVRELLATEHAAFTDPLDRTGPLVPAETYLSGAIGQKIEQALEAAENDPTFEPNVEALRLAAPHPVPAEKIDARLGAPWIPTTVIEEFAREILEVHVEVSHYRATGDWLVKLDEWLPESKDSVANSEQWAFTPPRPAPGKEVPNLVGYDLDGDRPLRYGHQLLEKALNNGTPTITQQIEDVRREHPEFTRAAAKVKERIERAFASWVWQDTKRTQALTAAFNRDLASTKPPAYRGSALTFPGISQDITPHSHQMDFVARALAVPPGTGAINAHVMGAGKTITMFMTAIKHVRLGLATNPIIVVPNGLLADITREGKQLFPGARILMATNDDLASPEARRRFTYKCAANSWDAIVMTTSLFERIPLDTKDEGAFHARRRAELGATFAADAKDAQGAHAKRISKKIKARDRRAKEALSKSPKDRETLSWTRLTGQRPLLLIDEASELMRNLGEFVQAEGVGMSKPAKATDAFTKARVAQESGGKVLLFTGTPYVRNAIDLYTLMYIVDPKRLERHGVFSGDDFARNFLRFETVLEPTANGAGVNLRVRVRSLINEDQMRSLFAEFADVKRDKDLNLDLPELEQLTHKVEASPALRELADDLALRETELKGWHTEPGDDTYLSLVATGRAAALDPALVGLAEDGPSKLDVMADKIAERYHQTKDFRFHDDPPTITGQLQLAFLNQGVPHGRQGNSYGRLRDKLVARGVPTERIEFVHDHEGARKRAQLYGGARKANPNVLIGSFAKMGYGTNVQTRLSDIHVGDVEWNPADLIQAIKRGHRQGNRLPKVTVHYYPVEFSIDARMFAMNWQRLVVQEQALDGGHEGTVSGEAGEFKATQLGSLSAIASGNPRLQELEDLNHKLEDLEDEANTHQSMRKRTSDKLREGTRRVAELERERVQAIKLAQVVTAHPHTAVYAGTSTTPLSEKQVAERLNSATRAAIARDSKAADIALTYRGLAVYTQRAMPNDDCAAYAIVHTDNAEHRVALQEKWTRKGQHFRLVRAVLGAIDHLPELPNELTDQITKTEHDNESARAIQDQPFERTAELEALRTEVAVLEDDLAREQQDLAERVRRAEELTLTDPTPLLHPDGSQIQVGWESSGQMALNLDPDHFQLLRPPQGWSEHATPGRTRLGRAVHGSHWVLTRETAPFQSPLDYTAHLASTPTGQVQSRIYVTGMNHRTGSDTATLLRLSSYHLTYGEALAEVRRYLLTELPKLHTPHHVPQALVGTQVWDNDIERLVRQSPLTVLRSGLEEAGIALPQGTGASAPVPLSKMRGLYSLVRLTSGHTMIHTIDDVDSTQQVLINGTRLEPEMIAEVHSLDPHQPRRYLQTGQDPLLSSNLVWQMAAHPGDALSSTSRSLRRNIHATSGLAAQGRVVECVVDRHDLGHPVPESQRFVSVHATVHDTDDSHLRLRLPTPHREMAAHTPTDHVSHLAREGGDPDKEQVETEEYTLLRVPMSAVASVQVNNTTRRWERQVQQTALARPERPPVHAEPQTPTTSPEPVDARLAPEQVHERALEVLQGALSTESALREQLRSDTELLLSSDPSTHVRGYLGLAEILTQAVGQDLPGFPRHRALAHHVALALSEEGEFAAAARVRNAFTRPSDMGTDWAQKTVHDAREWALSLNEPLTTQVQNLIRERNSSPEDFEKLRAEIETLLVQGRHGNAVELLGRAREIFVDRVTGQDWAWRSLEDRLNTVVVAAAHSHIASEPYRVGRPQSLPFPRGLGMLLGRQVAVLDRRGRVHLDRVRNVDHRCWLITENATFSDTDIAQVRTTDNRFMALATGEPGDMEDALESLGEELAAERAALIQPFQEGLADWVGQPVQVHTERTVMADGNLEAITTVGLLVRSARAQEPHHIRFEDVNSVTTPGHPRWWADADHNAIEQHQAAAERFLQVGDYVTARRHLARIRRQWSGMPTRLRQEWERLHPKLGERALAPQTEDGTPLVQIERSGPQGRTTRVFGAERRESAVNEVLDGLMSAEPALVFSMQDNAFVPAATWREASITARLDQLREDLDASGLAHQTVTVPHPEPELPMYPSQDVSPSHVEPHPTSTEAANTVSRKLKSQPTAEAAPRPRPQGQAIPSLEPGEAAVDPAHPAPDEETRVGERENTTDSGESGSSQSTQGQESALGRARAALDEAVNNDLGRRSPEGRKRSSALRVRLHTLVQAVENGEVEREAALELFSQVNRMQPDSVYAMEVWRQRIAVPSADSEHFARALVVQHDQLQTSVRVPAHLTTEVRDLLLRHGFGPDSTQLEWTLPDRMKPDRERSLNALLQDLDSHPGVERMRQDYADRLQERATAEAEPMTWQPQDEALRERVNALVADSDLRQAWEEVSTREAQMREASGEAALSDAEIAALPVGYLRATILTQARLHERSLDEERARQGQLTPEQREFYELRYRRLCPHLDAGQIRDRMELSPEGTAALREAYGTLENLSGAQEALSVRGHRRRLLGAVEAVAQAAGAEQALAVLEAANNADPAGAVDREVLRTGLVLDLAGTGELPVLAFERHASPPKVYVSMRAPRHVRQLLHEHGWRGLGWPLEPMLTLHSDSDLDREGQVEERLLGTVVALDALPEPVMRVDADRWRVKREDLPAFQELIGQVPDLIARVDVLAQDGQVRRAAHLAGEAFEKRWSTARVEEMSNEPLLDKYSEVMLASFEHESELDTKLDALPSHDTDARLELGGQYWERCPHLRLEEIATRIGQPARELTPSGEDAALHAREQGVHTPLTLEAMAPSPDQPGPGDPSPSSSTPRSEHTTGLDSDRREDQPEQEPRQLTDAQDTLLQAARQQGFLMMDTIGAEHFSPRTAEVPSASIDPAATVSEADSQGQQEQLRREAWQVLTAPPEQDAEASTSAETEAVQEQATSAPPVSQETGQAQAPEPTAEEHEAEPSPAPEEHATEPPQASPHPLADELQPWVGHHVVIDNAQGLDQGAGKLVGFDQDGLRILQDRTKVVRPGGDEYTIPYADVDHLRSPTQGRWWANRDHNAYERRLDAARACLDRGDYPTARAHLSRARSAFVRVRAATNKQEREWRAPHDDLLIRATRPRDADGNPVLHIERTGGSVRVYGAGGRQRSASPTLLKILETAPQLTRDRERNAYQIAGYRTETVEPRLEQLLRDLEDAQIPFQILTFPVPEPDLPATPEAVRVAATDPEQESVTPESTTSTQPPTPETGKEAADEREGPMPTPAADPLPLSARPELRTEDFHGSNQAIKDALKGGDLATAQRIHEFRTDPREGGVPNAAQQPGYALFSELSSAVREAPTVDEAVMRVIYRARDASLKRGDGAEALRLLALAEEISPENGEHTAEVRRIRADLEASEAGRRDLESSSSTTTEPEPTEAGQDRLQLVQASLDRGDYLTARGHLLRATAEETTEALPQERIQALLAATSPRDANGEPLLHIERTGPDGRRVRLFGAGGIEPALDPTIRQILDTPPRLFREPDLNAYQTLATWRDATIHARAEQLIQDLREAGVPLEVHTFPHPEPDLPATPEAARVPASTQQYLPQAPPAPAHDSAPTNTAEGEPEGLFAVERQTPTAEEIKRALDNVDVGVPHPIGLLNSGQIQALANARRAYARGDIDTAATLLTSPEMSRGKGERALQRALGHLVRYAPASPGATQTSEHQDHAPESTPSSPTPGPEEHQGAVEAAEPPAQEPTVTDPPPASDSTAPEQDRWSQAMDHLAAGNLEQARSVLSQVHDTNVELNGALREIFELRDTLHGPEQDLDSLVERLIEQARHQAAEYQRGRLTTPERQHHLNQLQNLQYRLGEPLAERIGAELQRINRDPKIDHLIPPLPWVAWERPEWLSDALFTRVQDQILSTARGLHALSPAEAEEATLHISVLVNAVADGPPEPLLATLREVARHDPESVLHHAEVRNRARAHARGPQSMDEALVFSSADTVVSLPEQVPETTVQVLRRHGFRPSDPATMRVESLGLERRLALLADLEGLEHPPLYAFHWHWRDAMQETWPPKDLRKRLEDLQRDQQVWLQKYPSLSQVTDLRSAAQSAHEIRSHLRLVGVIPGWAHYTHPEQERFEDVHADVLAEAQRRQQRLDRHYAHVQTLSAQDRLEVARQYWLQCPHLSQEQIRTRIPAASERPVDKPTQEKETAVPVSNQPPPGGWTEADRVTPRVEPEFTPEPGTDPGERARMAIEGIGTSHLYSKEIITFWDGLDQALADLRTEGRHQEVIDAVARVREQNHHDWWRWETHRSRAVAALDPGVVDRALVLHHERTANSKAITHLYGVTKADKDLHKTLKGKPLNLNHKVTEGRWQVNPAWGWDKHELRLRELIRHFEEQGIAYLSQQVHEELLAQRSTPAPAAEITSEAAPAEASSASEATPDPQTPRATPAAPEQITVTPEGHLGEVHGVIKAPRARVKVLSEFTYRSGPRAGEPGWRAVYDLGGGREVIQWHTERPDITQGQTLPDFVAKVRRHGWYNPGQGRPRRAQTEVVVAPPRGEVFPLTDEQAKIVEHALAGDLMVVQAGAGTGKTSTSIRIAEALTEQGRRGVYVVYGRANANEATVKMAHVPVQADTLHAIAFAAVGAPYSKRLKAPRPDPTSAMDELGVGGLDLASGTHLGPKTLYRILDKAVREFEKSADLRITPGHIHLPGYSPQDLAAVRVHLAPVLERAWADVANPNGHLLSFEHDSYVKLFHLNEGRIEVGGQGRAFAIIDEAQDMNKVAMAILRAQPHLQLMWVGDSAQAIHGWRGAIDALERQEPDVTLSLSKSFRFGPEVAEHANRYLAALDAPLRLEGNPALDSVVQNGPVADPDMILCRTNAGVFTEATYQLDQGRTVGIIGGTQDLSRLVQAAEDLRTGGYTEHPDLSHFASWKQVVEVARDSPEDLEQLAPFVRVIDTRGASEVRDYLARMSDSNPDVWLSTAHRAKGLEEKVVQIGDDFKAKTATDSEVSEAEIAAELRLKYVAVTRAKVALGLGSLAEDPDLGDAETSPEQLTEQAQDAPEAEVAPIDGVPEPRDEAPLSDSSPAQQEGSTPAVEGTVTRLAEQVGARIVVFDEEHTSLAMGTLEEASAQGVRVRGFAKSTLVPLTDLAGASTENGYWWADAERDGCQQAITASEAALDQRDFAAAASHLERAAVYWETGHMPSPAEQTLLRFSYDQARGRLEIAQALQEAGLTWEYTTVEGNVSEPHLYVIGQGEQAQRLTPAQARAMYVDGQPDQLATAQQANHEPSPDAEPGPATAAAEGQGEEFRASADEGATPEADGTPPSTRELLIDMGVESLLSIPAEGEIEETPYIAELRQVARDLPEELRPALTPPADGRLPDGPGRRGGLDWSQTPIEHLDALQERDLAMTAPSGERYLTQRGYNVSRLLNRMLTGPDTALLSPPTPEEPLDPKEAFDHAWVPDIALGGELEEGPGVARVRRLAASLPPRLVRALDRPTGKGILSSERVRNSLDWDTTPNKHMSELQQKEIIFREDGDWWFTHLGEAVHGLLWRHKYGPEKGQPVASSASSEEAHTNEEPQDQPSLFENEGETDTAAAEPDRAASAQPPTTAEEPQEDPVPTPEPASTPNPDSDIQQYLEGQDELWSQVRQEDGSWAYAIGAPGPNQQRYSAEELRAHFLTPQEAQPEPELAPEVDVEPELDGSAESDPTPYDDLADMEELTAEEAAALEASAAPAADEPREDTQTSRAPESAAAPEQSQPPAAETTTGRQRQPSGRGGADPDLDTQANRGRASLGNGPLSRRQLTVELPPGDQASLDPGQEQDRRQATIEVGTTAAAAAAAANRTPQPTTPERSQGPAPREGQVSTTEPGAHEQAGPGPIRIDGREIRAKDMGKRWQKVWEKQGRAEARRVTDPAVYDTMRSQFRRALASDQDVHLVMPSNDPARVREFIAIAREHGYEITLKATIPPESLRALGVAEQLHDQIRQGTPDRAMRKAEWQDEYRNLRQIVSDVHREHLADRLELHPREGATTDTTPVIRDHLIGTPDNPQWSLGTPIEEHVKALEKVELTGEEKRQLATRVKDMLQQMPPKDEVHELHQQAHVECKEVLNYLEQIAQGSQPFKDEARRTTMNVGGPEQHQAPDTDHHPESYPEEPPLPEEPHPHEDEHEQAREPAMAGGGPAPSREEALQAARTPRPSPGGRRPPASPKHEYGAPTHQAGAAPRASQGPRP